MEKNAFFFCNCTAIDLQSRFIRGKNEREKERTQCYVLPTKQLELMVFNLEALDRIKRELGVLASPV